MIDSSCNYLMLYANMMSLKVSFACKSKKSPKLKQQNEDPIDPFG